MDQQQFAAAVAAGQFVRRPDGTYVQALSLAARPGFDTRVCRRPAPASNINQEYGSEVAGSFFRSDVAAEAVHLSINRDN